MAKIITTTKTSENKLCTYQYILSKKKFFACIYCYMFLTFCIPNHFNDLLSVKHVHSAVSPVEMGMHST